MTSIVLFRQDLRVDDHAPLIAAAERGPVMPLFIWSPEEEGAWAPGGASRWWLHHSLAWLAKRLESMGSRLILRSGPVAETLREVARACDAREVHCERRYEPFVDDERLAATLAHDGITLVRHEGALLYPLDDLRTGSGRPYQVYTPFSKALKLQEQPARPRAAPALVAPPRWPTSESLDAWKLLPEIPWDGGLRSHWTPGGEGAAALLKRFLGDPIERYAEDRERPDIDGSSRLSAHLHVGEISVRRVWHTVGDAIRRRNDADFTKHAEKFRSEVLWREFGYNILLHFPHTDLQPLRVEYAMFPWTEDPAALRAWKRGRTGYPIVDAGMRQLWHTGWMHNRVRMIVASFLVKHLLLPWQEGAKWFWETLVDADLANNSLGWQWSAGSGADAAPYFRIFNPILQGEKFDPDGAYVRRWVPELARVPSAWIHKPWEAPPLTLAGAGVELGLHYPKPIVDHGFARDRALEALAALSLLKEEA